MPIGIKSPTVVLRDFLVAHRIAAQVSVQWVTRNPPRRVARYLGITLGDAEELSHQLNDALVLWSENRGV